MFVGHLAVALGAKKVEPRVPLWGLVALTGLLWASMGEPTVGTAGAKLNGSCRDGTVHVDATALGRVDRKTPLLAWNPQRSLRGRCEPFSLYSWDSLC